MVIISIGTDASPMHATSGGIQRIRQYAAHVDAFHSVHIGKGKSSYLHKAPWINGSLYASGGLNMFFAALKSVVYVARLIKKMHSSHHSKNIIIACQDPFLSGVCGALASVLTSTVLHVQIDTDVYDDRLTRSQRGGWLGLLTATWVLRAADRIVCTSQRSAASLIRHGISHARIDVVHDMHGEHIHDHPAIAPIRLREHPLSLITVALPGQDRNVEVALRTFARLHQAFPGAVLHIVGFDVSDRRLQLLIRSLRLRDNVAFHRASQQPFGHYVTEADLFLNTSYMNGIGAPLLEAALARVPIVSCRTGGVGYEISESSIFTIPQISVQHCVSVLENVLAQTSIWPTKAEVSREQALRIMTEVHHVPEYMVKSWQRALAAHLSPK